MIFSVSAIPPSVSLLSGSLNLDGSIALSTAAASSAEVCHCEAGSNRTLLDSRPGTASGTTIDACL